MYVIKKKWFNADSIDMCKWLMYVAWEPLIITQENIVPVVGECITPCGWTGCCLHNERTKMVTLSTASFEWCCLCRHLEETSSMYHMQLFQMLQVWTFPYPIESWLWYWAALCVHLYTGSSGTWCTCWSLSSLICCFTCSPLLCTLMQSAEPNFSPIC